MKVFVIGGNGFIGSAVVRRLLDDGHSVRCLLRRTSRTDRIDGLAWERCEGDVRDEASLAAGLTGCDGVIHLASPSSWNDINSPLLRDVVVEGTRNVIKAARACAGTRVVFCSSAVAINASSHPRVFDETTEFSVSDPRLRYAHCKHEAESLCRDAALQGLPVIIVNPGEVYGPNDTDLVTAGNLIDFAKSNPVLVCHGGTSVAFVDDVALGIVRALEKGRPGERYILGGENLTVRQLAVLCLALLGRKRRVVTLPTPVIRGVTRFATLFKIPLPYNPQVIPYATRYWFMDASKATRELGVRFRPAEETLAPTLSWLQETGRIS